MKLLTALMMTSALVLTSVAFVPSASADTCIFFDKELERTVCAPMYLVYCIEDATLGKGGLKAIALCDGSL